jgi:hypothetical protein
MSYADMHIFKINVLKICSDYWQRITLECVVTKKKVTIMKIFQFKFRHWLSGILKRKIDSDIKVLNHILLKLASDHDEQKTKPSTARVQFYMPQASDYRLISKTD